MAATRTARLVTVGAAVLLTLSLALPASSSATVKRGDFEPLDVPDLAIDGHAELLITADGRTKVSVHVEGLEPGATYPSHVHNQACDDGRGGGHYQDEVGGATTPPNELWPSSDPKDPEAGLTANAAGVANGKGWAPWEARPEAQSVVIHQTGNPSVRIACADLA